MHGKLPRHSVSSIQIRKNPLVRGALMAIALPFALGMTLAHSAERTGESVVNEVCATCHKTGEKGAPVIGDKNAWAKRKEQGLTKLNQHAVEGIRNMPSHGGNAGLSSIDLERAITYMVNKSGGNWTDPVNKAAPGKARTGEQLVKTRCGDCHVTGKDGAPKIGDREAWVGRVSGGLDKVVASGIHGRGAMPARGGMADISDAEMRAAVVYMFTESTAPKQ
jgi:cytochrome c5